MRRLALGWLACMVLASAPAWAQETRGSVVGIVKDSSGGILPGVTIEAKGAANTQSAVTDSTGAYRFPALQPGTYTLKSTLSGFVSVTVEDVQVQLGIQLKIDITMKVAGVTESVSVTAESPIVDVKQNSVTAVVSKDLIDLIPKDRSWLSAITGIAGTGNEGRGGGIMIDGAGASENRYIIDGMDVTNLRTGVLGSDRVIDFIDQVQVKQSGYNAEYRASTGGVISAITRSGTDKYSGDLGAYYDGKSLSWLLGDVRPTLRLVPTNNNLAEYFTTPRLNETNTWDPVYDVGGPILKKRVWFFFGYNPRWSEQNRTVTWTAPGAFPPTQSFESKTTDGTYTYNVTNQLTHSIRLRFNGSNERTSNGLGVPAIDATNGTSTANPALWNPRPTTYTAGFNDSYNGTMDWVVTNRTYMNVSAGYLGYGSHTSGGDYYHGIVRSFSTTNVGYLDVPANLQQPSGYTDHSSNSFNIKDNYNRLNIGGDLTTYRDWKGEHAFKFGLQWERLGNGVDTGQQYPNISIRWNASHATLDNQNLRGTYGYYEVRRTYTIGDIHSNNIGIFLQDQWTISNKLTLNYGLRTDRTDIPSYRAENPGITFGFKDKMAPRLGFAYDIKGDSKWKAYGSWGIFYDIEKLEMPRGAWGADHWISYYWSMNSYDWPSINCDGTPTSGCPGVFQEQVDFRHVSNSAGNSLVDPNLKPYKTEELVFGLDHELTRVIRVGTRWSHKWLDKTFEDVGVQVPGVGEVFYMANPGEGLGAYPLGTSYPRTPYPVRHYDGVEFNFQRRLSNHWSLSSNFLISRTYGTYSGLTSSDESGRNSPNVNRFYDGLYISFDQKAQVVTGRLQTDRPFQFKTQFTYVMPWDTTSMGVNYVAESGLLQSTTVTYLNLPIYVFGRGDLGRAPTFSYTDLNFTQSIKLGHGMRGSLQFLIYNLFDQDTTTGFATAAYRDPLVLSGGANQFFAGFNSVALMSAANAANANTGRPDARYNKPSSFNGARTARIYFKLTF